MTGNDGDIDTLVDRVYDIAVAPERMDQLVDSWMERLGERGQSFELLTEPRILRHVQRAETLLRELIAISGEERNSARDWSEGVRAAALVVNRSGVVIAANMTAQRTLWLTPGNTLSVLPVVPDDLAVLSDLIDQLDTAMDSEARLLRLRKTGETAPILIRIVEAVGGDPNQIGLVTSILAWPDTLSSQLASSFRLTPAETEVMKHLTHGLTVKEIAEKTQRNELTIRSHVRALLEKTGTRTQMELVRVTLGLMDVVEQGPKIAPLRGPPGIDPEPNHYNTVTLPDRRRLDYLVIGDQLGRPFLMLPTDAGFTRLPPAAEQWLADNRMRMIVPVRAGYGHSSPIPKRRDAYEVAVADMQALCDHLRIDRCPILAFCDDFHLAVSATCTAPERVIAIIGVGPTMPATTAEHYQRMPKWTRFIYANARFARLALPYVTMAFFLCIRRLGPKRFIQMMLASSPADQRVLDDNEILTSMLRGSEISVGPRFTAHVAFAAGMLANYAVDWSGKLKSCPVPMILFAGREDPFAPIETTREFAAITPNITLHEYPDYGQLLYPLWPKFLEVVKEHLAN